VFGGRSFAIVVGNEESSLGACATSLLMWGKPSTSERPREDYRTLSRSPFGRSACGYRVGAKSADWIAAPHFPIHAPVVANSFSLPLIMYIAQLSSTTSKFKSSLEIIRLGWSYKGLRPVNCASGESGDSRLGVVRREHSVSYY